MSPPLDRNPSTSKLRALAGTFAFVGLLVALGPARENHASTVLGATALLVVATLIPRLGRWIHVAWMSFGLLLGRLTSPVILGLVFFFVVVPIACLGRVAGRRRLRPFRERDAETYWESVPEREKATDYFRPF